MSKLILVDSHNRRVGSASAAEVQKDLLYHREAMVLARDETGRLLLRQAVQEPLKGRWGVTGREMQRVGEESEDTARRMLGEMGLAPSGPIRKVGRMPASWELGFAFLTIFVADVCIEKEEPSLVPMEIERCSRLADYATDCFTYHLCQALRFCPQFCEPPASSALSEALDQFFNFPEGRTLLPSYEAVAVSDGAATELLGEISNHHNRDPWLHDLLGLFENIRPYYPAPYGLEIGELLLGATSITRGIEKIAHAIASRRTPVRVVGKLESGRVIADELERMLRTFGSDVERFDIATTWLRHGEARQSDNPSATPLSRRRNLICDTMISSGATFNAIRTSLLEQGGGEEAEAVVLAAVDRSRYYFPSEIHALRSVEGHDWIVGFNSDAPSKRGNVGRSLPFLATLKPRGTGTRATLIDSLL